MPSFASVQAVAITTCESTSAPAPTSQNTRGLIIRNPEAASTRVAAPSHSRPIEREMGSLS